MEHIICTCFLKNVDTLKKVIEHYNDDLSRFSYSYESEKE